MIKKISVIAIVAFFFGLAGTAQAWTEEKKAKLEACMSDCEMSTMAYTMARYQCENDCYDEYWNTSGSLETTEEKTTQFASTLSGDSQPACGTDAWACFNGTDDESPAIRDIGIFSVFASK